MDFNSLGLCTPILDAIGAKGYNKPTPIQAQAIPAVLSGQDVMGAAQTGTGKTAGFTLPILERLRDGKRARSNHVRALILTPTRELAAQVEDSIKAYGCNLPMRSLVVFGGVKINPQMMALRKGVDILVATPGRLLDLCSQNAVRLNQVEIVVLDEADRMLDMGFIRDIRKIASLLPRKRQTLMFSATFSNDVRSLAKTLVDNPVEISVSPRNTTVEIIDQWICTVDKKRKPALLGKLVNDNGWFQVLVFTRTKHGANRLVRQLEGDGIEAAAIHGNKSQNQRTRALADFKNLKTQVLVATDIAARGLDINQLPHVVNFDLPNVAEDYIHRIGRTGRAGAGGEAVSLVSADEADMLSAIESLIRQKLPRQTVPGFEPVHDVPDSKLVRKNDAPRKRRKNPGYTPDAGSQDRKGDGNQSSRGRTPVSNIARKKNASSKKRRWNAGNKQVSRTRQAA